MLFSFAGYELRYRFRILSTYIYLFVFTSLSFLVVCLAGGAFPGVNVNIGRSGDFVHFNGPTFIMGIYAVFMLFGTLVIAAVFGSSASRDFETGSFPLYFTKPIGKTAYVMGRFIGSAFTVLIIFAGIGIGVWLGTLMPFMKPANLGSNRLVYYLQPYYYLVLPNLMFMGLAFFGVTLLTRRVMSAYIVAIVLFLGYMLAQVMIDDTVSNRWAVLTDPFGLSSWTYDTRYWSTAEYNEKMLPLAGMMFYNRILWLGLAMVGWVLMIRRISLGHEQSAMITTSYLRKRRHRDDSPPAFDPVLLSRIKPRPYDTLRQTFILTKTEVKAIRSTPSFYVIASVFLLFLIISASQVGKIFGTTTYPLTSKMLMILQGNLFLFGMIISTFFAGDLLWRERILKMDQIADVTPHHDIVRFLSKFLAVIVMQLVILALIMVTGVCVQAVQGYYHFEIGQYLFQLLIIAFPVMIIYTLAAFFFATVIPNKYAGYLAMILFYVAFMLIPGLGLDHKLIVFNSGAGVTYSEMNGFGDYLGRFFWIRLYWGLFAILMTMVALRFWPRGTASGFRERLRIVRQAGFDKHWKVSVVMLAAFIAVGGFIFYNTNILNEYHTPKYSEKALVRYEKQYKHLQKIAQPRISGVSVKVDLYPSKREINVSGFYHLVNRGNRAVDSLVVDYSTQAKPSRIDFGRPADILFDDREFGLRVYKLARPLAPGDSLKMDFAVAYRSRGFSNDGPNTSVAANGTFVHSTYFPHLGYNPDGELSDPAKRRTYGLADKPRVARLEDMAARNNNYISRDADWIRFHAIVGTDGDQIAFAPGNLIREWKENSRNYAEYSTPTPILYYVAFVSGRYEKTASRWNGIDVEVYHHPKHDYNTNRMLTAAMATLDYGSAHFTPYPFRVLRIVEVPYVYFAQSFPTIIPFSENMGFVARVNPDDPTDVDYPFYITAHEVAHQWWAHIVIGADVQGSTMFSESLAQYTSLMLMKKQYDRDRMRRFLTYESDAYLSGRADEDREEQPLVRVENQQYIHYNKGSLTFFGLQDDLGEALVNRALGDFCRKHAYRATPYPVSTDLMQSMHTVFGDSLNLRLTDLFETITLYDNRVTGVSTRKNAGGFLTRVDFTTAKMRCDGHGGEKQIPMSENLEIAIYEKNNEHPIASVIVPVDGGGDSVVLQSKEKPDTVILDPLYKLVDRGPLDNQKTIE